MKTAIKNVLFATKMIKIPAKFVQTLIQIDTRKFQKNVPVRTDISKIPQQNYAKNAIFNSLVNNVTKLVYAKCVEMKTYYPPYVRFKKQKTSC